MKLVSWDAEGAETNALKSIGKVLFHSSEMAKRREGRKFILEPFTLTFGLGIIKSNVAPSNVLPFHSNLEKFISENGNFYFLNLY